MRLYGRGEPENKHTGYVFIAMGGIFGEGNEDKMRLLQQWFSTLECQYSQHFPVQNGA